MKYCDSCHSTYPTEFTVCPKDQTALRETSELPDGSILRGKYEVLSKIGAGGMATVYKVKHLAFNEVRALKLLGRNLLDNPEFMARFKNEAMVTRKMRHPSAVAVEDFDQTEDGRPFIVMEYVEGQSLRDLLHAEGPFKPQRALAITRQVAAVLGEAHKLGIVHRDIKPDNILISKQPNGAEFVKVLDFGIAKLREAPGVGGGLAQTQTGMVMGTPQYISPEQAMGNKSDTIDGRADLYSLGIVLYEMLTGELPFTSDTPMGMLMDHIHKAPTPAHALKPDLNIPQPLSLLLMKALEKDREQRFQTADEMLKALDRPQHWASTALMGSASGTQLEPASRASGIATAEEPVPFDEMDGFPAVSKPMLFDEERARRSSYEDWLAEEEKNDTKPAETKPAEPRHVEPQHVEPKIVEPVPVASGPKPTPMAATALATPQTTAAAAAAARPAPFKPAPGPPPPVKIGVKPIAPVPVSLPTPPRRMAPMPPPKPDYRNHIIGGAALVIVVLLIGGYFLWPRSQPPSPTALSSPTASNPTAPAAGTEDARIFDDVKKMLSTATSDTLRANPPLVAVDKGVVTLSGRVTSHEDYELAYQLAGTVDGVSQVVNQMKIGGVGGPRDTSANMTNSTLTPARPTPTPNNQNLSPEEANSVALGDLARKQRQQNNAQSQVDQSLRQGYNAMQSQDWDAAIQHFQTVLQLDPGNPAAQMGLRRAQRMKAGGGSRRKR
jgi:eukaryotic-like serine/threonine-protein kinase